MGIKDKFATGGPWPEKVIFGLPLSHHPKGGSVLGYGTFCRTPFLPRSPPNDNRIVKLKERLKHLEEVAHPPAGAPP